MNAGESATARTIPVGGLLTAGVILGVAGDILLRVGGPPGLNLFLWIASVALAALVLHRRMGLAPDRERIAWLAAGVLFAAGLVWRDSPVLKLLALGAATLAFALAAYRPMAAWVRRAGVVQYGVALGLGALHAWVAAALALFEAARSASRIAPARAGAWRRLAAVVRGLAIAAPLVAVFGALFMSADAMFADLVLNLVRFDLERVATHVVLFSVTAWLATGYLRGYLASTERPFGSVLGVDSAGALLAPLRPTLGLTEVATALAALDLLFLAFVLVQFRYLFGGDALVQLTAGLTYAEYARRGFFELVVAACLVVPVLLAADWLRARRTRHADVMFRSLAGVLIALVLAIAASALERLRLYRATYGLTEDRFYALVLLIWMGAMLVWLAATVLRGRRESFAYGALLTGLSTIALLFVLNPDAIVARTNVERLMSADTPARFDVAYAATLSADAVPVLMQALPALPADVQCPLARHLLRRWPADRERAIRTWNRSASAASDAVRRHEAALRAMVGPGQRCAGPAGHP
jgi:hypothetical protein